MVIARLIENKRWPNITKYPGCFEYVGPFIKKHTGERYTGFDSTNQDVKERLEKVLHTDLSPASPFWDTFFVRFNDEDIIFDEKVPSEELKIIFLQNHPECASPDNQNDPMKTFVLVDEEKQHAKENAKARIERMIARTVDEMSDNDIRNALRLFGINPDGVSNETCMAHINKIVKANPSHFKEVWIDNPTREASILFFNALGKGIIQKKQSVYYYGAEPLGTTPEAASLYLSEDKNIETRQGVYMSLQGGTLPEPKPRGRQRSVQPEEAL